ncbi:MAG: hypothetical protein V3U82_00560 [Robiginitomaculum sp.]
MIKTSSLCASLLIIAGLTACKPAANDGARQSVSPPAAAMENQISISATHAFGTASPVKTIAFSPNDVASWLGAIGLLTDDGVFLTTNIEGKKFNSHGDGFTGLAGLDRPGLAALFIALDRQGRLRPFVESDNVGGFKPAPISSSAPPLAHLCGVSEAQILTAITKAGQIISFGVSGGGAIALTSKGAPHEADGEITDCATDKNGETYRLETQAEQLYVRNSVGNETAIASAALAHQARLTLIAREGETAPILAITGLDAEMSLYDGQSLEPIVGVDIISGLSISGLTQPDAIAATDAGFGGSGFNEGIIVLSERGEGRIVVLARSYLLDQVTP